MNTADPYRDTRRLIDTHGWAVIGVFSTCAEDGPPFSYTVGLTAITLATAPHLAVALVTASIRLVCAGQFRSSRICLVH